MPGSVMVTAAELSAWVIAVPSCVAVRSKTSGCPLVTAAAGVDYAVSACASAAGPVAPVAPVAPVEQVTYGNYFVICSR